MKPQLLKISENEYACSLGDWKTEAIKPEKLNQAQWEHRREKQFQKHVTECHEEDFSQAAVRIVREATEE